MKPPTVGALLAALSVFVIATSATAGSLTIEVDGVRVGIASTPDPPVTDVKTAYTVQLLEAAGKPITDARVTLTGRMADGMTAASPLRSTGEAGVYRGKVLFTMAGPWDLTVRVVRPTGRVEIPLREVVVKHR